MVMVPLIEHGSAVLRNTESAEYREERYSPFAFSEFVSVFHYVRFSIRLLSVTALGD